MVPVELAEKYRSMGLKPADAFIAGYCEWVKTDFLVTENRHFVLEIKYLPFKVKKAKEILEEMHH